MSVNTFNDDIEIANTAMKYQDEIYRFIFPIKNIIRFSKTDRHILDKEFHIDVELELENGIKLLGQEKALRKMFSSFDTFTIEFYQNRHTKERGEFFNLGAQFYTHGYVNGNKPEEITGFGKLYIIKIFDFLEWLKQMPIAELESKTKPSSSRASFYYIKYDEIPEQFIYFKI